MATTDEEKVQSVPIRSNWKLKLLEIVGLPVLGAALIASVQVLFPPVLDKMKRFAVGNKLQYVMLEVNDTNANKPPEITNLTLTEYYGVLSGELRIPPDEAQNIPEGGRRLYSGFIGGDGFLVLAYKSDPPLHGIGEYFLVRHDDGDYTGYSRINICTSQGQIIKQCNAVLTKNQSRAMQHFSKMLRRQCELVVFPSPDDDSDKVAQKEPCPEAFVTSQR